jgi:hypothetical protein
MSHISEKPRGGGPAASLKSSSRGRVEQVSGFIRAIDVGQAPISDLADDAEFHELELIDLANHLAWLGGRSVLEALRAVRRGQKIHSVLDEFQSIPRWRGLRVVARSA